MVKGNSKAKKRPQAKKVASYDTKIILYVVLGIAVLTAAIVAAVSIISYTGSFVGRVNGKRVMNYEYKYTLQDVMSEMENEAKEAWTDTEKEFSSTDFWTDEKKSEAAEKALVKAAEFEGEYQIARKNGGKLTKTEMQNIDTNLEYYAYLYYQQYSNYYTYDQILQMFFGIDDLETYEKYLHKLETVNKYRDAQEAKYQVSDLYFGDQKGEDAIKAKYADDLDNYRRVNMTTLVLAKAAAPVEPAAVEEPKEPENKDETSDEYLKYKDALDKYNKYLTDKAAYDEKMIDYTQESADLDAKVKTLFDALSKDGKYTGKGFSELTTEEKDADGNAVKAIPEYTDGTLEDIAAKEGKMFASTKGAYTFSGTVDEDSTEIEKLAQSIVWTDGTRTAVKSSLEGYELESVQKDGKFSETKLVLAQDDDYYYITKCTGIDDLDTSTSEEADEDGVISVRSAVINDLKNTKSDDDLKKLVADAGSKFEMTNKKQKNIDAVKKAVQG